jgi:hypothetical protein
MTWELEKPSFNRKERGYGIEKFIWHKKKWRNASKSV